MLQEIRVRMMALGLVIAMPLAPACSASSVTAQGRTVVLREDWIEADMRLIDSMLAASHETGASVDAVLAHFASSSTGARDDRDLGFGARRSSFGVGGGYVSVGARMVVTVPAADEPAQLIALVLDLHCSADAFAQLSERIAQKLGPPTDAKAHVWKLGRKGEVGHREVVARIERQLGSAGEMDVPAELRAAFDKLTSPSEPLVLGSRCGFVGFPPPGCSETKALVAANRFDLVRGALRGLNPEGRAWAAHALLQRKAAGVELDPADERAIEKLARLPLDLETCNGCIGGHARFREAIAGIEQ